MPIHTQPKARPRRTICTTAAAVAIATLTLSACSSAGTSGTSGTQPGSTGGSTPAAKADSSLFALLPASIRASKTVRVASNAPFPPFEMFTGPGGSQFTGFDYDLGQALGAELGVKFVFTQTPFDGMIPALQAGKYDLIMASLTVTPEREQAVSFVTYFQSGTGILVKKGNLENIQSVSCPAFSGQAICG